jgi:hypothetical protein
LPTCLGEGADVMRTGAAAHAEVADVQREGLAPELRDLEAVARERIERDGKRLAAVIVVVVLVAQRLERRLVGRRAVRHRQRGHRRLDGLPDLAQQRHHRGGAADAVEAHDVRARVGEALARVGDAPLLARHVLLVHRKRDDRGLPGLLDHVERDQRLGAPRERLTDDEVDPCLDGPLHLLLEHRPHGLVRARIGRVVDVGVADVRRRIARRSRARRQRAICSARRFDRLEVLLAADHAPASRGARST